jgi:hypothetical protein
MKGSNVNKSQRMLPAVVIAGVLALGSAASFAACGDDDDDDNVPATEPGGTEPMVDTTEAMTDTTQAMVDTTEAMVDTTEVMVDTTGG